jgi:hypothetical protein
MYNIKQPAPSYFMQETCIIIPAHPNKYGFANNVVLRNKTPVTRIFGIMAVIAHHPVIIHFKGISIGFLSVDVYIVAFYFNLIMLINLDTTLVNGKFMLSSLTVHPFLGMMIGPKLSTFQP